MKEISAKAHGDGYMSFSSNFWLDFVTVWGVIRLNLEPTQKADCISRIFIPKIDSPVLFPGKTLVSRCPLRRRVRPGGRLLLPWGQTGATVHPLRACSRLAGSRPNRHRGLQPGGSQILFLDFLKSSKENPVDRMKGNRDNVQFAQRQRGCFICSVN